MPAPRDDDGDRRRVHPDLQQQIRQTRAEIRDQVRATRLQFDEANARITERTGRNLVFAIAVGLGLGAALVISLSVQKELFVVVAAVLVGVATFELAGALRHAGRTVPRVGSVVAGVAAQPVAYLLAPAGWFWAIVGAIALAVVWRLVTAVRRPVPGRDLVQDLGATAFVQLYVTLLASCATVLTALPGGQAWTFSFICVVVAADVFAYVAGLLFGKHPMAPRISPKKTWEGFAGSGTAAVIVAIVLGVVLLGRPVWFDAIFGVVILVTGTLGDLGESMIKRDIGVKDISTWLPGHGGFLDRVDSILPSSAAALLLYFLAH